MCLPIYTNFHIDHIIIIIFNYCYFRKTYNITAQKAIKQDDDCFCEQLDDGGIKCSPAGCQNGLQGILIVTNLGFQELIIIIMYKSQYLLRCGFMIKADHI